MKALGKSLFAVSGTAIEPRPQYERVLAADMNLKESWFRDAIFCDPELVLGPCREAKHLPADEQWFPWATECNFGSGPVDVLLVSSYGRVAIVETKLSYNPQKRREVVAQVLDYALALQDAPEDELPPLPVSESAPDPDDLTDCLRAGRFLLIIAGDTLDPRAIRLSQALLAGHLTAEWDLAMVDINLYRSTRNPTEMLLVPELRGTLIAETRQVVRVHVEGAGRTTVQVERLPSEDATTVERTRGRLESPEQFLARVREVNPIIAEPARQIAEKLSAAGIASEGKLSFALQSATANLYACLDDGTTARVLSLSSTGRFRVWLGYLRNRGRDDLVARVQDAASPFIKLNADDNSSAISVDASNVGVILSAVSAIATSIGAQHAHERPARN